MSEIDWKKYRQENFSHLHKDLEQIFAELVILFQLENRPFLSSAVWEFLSLDDLQIAGFFKASLDIERHEILYNSYLAPLLPEFEKHIDFPDGA